MKEQGGCDWWVDNIEYCWFEDTIGCFHSQFRPEPKIPKIKNE